jgi:hypothetical protein
LTLAHLSRHLTNMRKQGTDRRDDCPADDGFDSLKLDRSRMEGIEMRVAEQLRHAGWRSDKCEVVLDFSALSERHGKEIANHLVWPIEMAITQQGWAATRELVCRKGRLVERIVALKPCTQSPET